MKGSYGRYSDVEGALSSDSSTFNLITGVGVGRGCVDSGGESIEDRCYSVRTLACACLQVVGASTTLTFRRRIKSRLPFAGIIRRLPYSTRFQDKG